MSLTFKPEFAMMRLDDAFGLPQPLGSIRVALSLFWSDKYMTYWFQLGFTQPKPLILHLQQKRSTRPFGIRRFQTSANPNFSPVR